MNFEEYLASKKIDSASFFVNEMQLFKEFKTIFDQVSPASFTQQKLFLINGVRRKYPVKK